MGNPAIGVIVVNWNTFDLLRRCLASLAGQTVAIRRTVVVDNGSTKHAEELPDERPPATRYIRLDQNIGFAKANNRAAAELRDCQWIALVNPDAFLAPDCLEEFVHATRRHPKVTCFGAVTLMENDPTRFDGTGDVYHASGLVWRQGHGVPIDDIQLEEREIFSPCAAIAFYQREAYEAVGGLDDDYFCYNEDVDLGVRLRLAGHRCVLVPTARALHVGSASSGGQRSDFAVYHGHRNLVWTFLKNMPGVLFWALLPLHVLMNLVTLVYFSLRGQGIVILRAKRDAIKGIPKMWRKRRAIQAQRKASIKEVWRILDKRLLPFRRE